MTTPDDPGKKGELTPQGNAPSWVDEVMDASRKAPAPAPSPVAPPAPATPPAPAPQPAAPSAARPAPPTAWPEDLRLPDPAPTPPRPAADGATDDWVARATGAQAKSPSLPQGPAVVPPPVRSDLDTLGDSARHAMQQVQSALKSAGAGAAGVGSGGVGSGEVGQKKLIAGLLAIFLGSFGVHKFYLGLTTPGLILLGVNVGVWVLALLLGLLTLGLGLIVTVPLAGLVSAAIGLFALVEGILYLTKSDEQFARDYLGGKKPWL